MKNTVEEGCVVVELAEDDKLVYGDAFKEKLKVL